jgi:hypothetical protein
MFPISSSSVAASKSWRHDAARIVEELFQVTPAACWDMLLDLRQNLLAGTDWNKTLDIFLACRETLEAEHYLPFYRLRRLLTESLRLEAGTQQTSLKSLLWKKHRSLADLTRAVTRELFEHDLTTSVDRPLDLRVVER